MKKNLAMAFILLSVTILTVEAAQNKVPHYKKDYSKYTNGSSYSQELNNYSRFDKQVEDSNFEDNSHYISDEQLQDAKEIEVIDNNTSFWSRVINSGHFSSDTATKTYIPINKILQ